MSQRIDVAYCFYDDPAVPRTGTAAQRDADRYSPILREFHRVLWSKPLPNGEPGGACFELRTDIEWPCLIHSSPLGYFRLSSDTIASTHRAYRRHGVDLLWEQLSPAERDYYDRAFYTIGGFIVFPRHPRSMNQQRGTNPKVQDRFDLTLECIRRFYDGDTALDTNPLRDVLQEDRHFYALFGAGTEGFANYVTFFHLGDLVTDGRVSWLHPFTGYFEDSPLPKTMHEYRSFLGNVHHFVAARNKKIARSLEDSR